MITVKRECKAERKGIQQVIKPITYLKNSLSLLQKYQRFLIVLALDEVVCRVSELCEDDGDLVLVDLDLLVVHLVERVALLTANLVSLLPCVLRYIILPIASARLFDWH